MEIRSVYEITDFECIELCKIIGGSDHISEKSKIAQVKELLKGIHNKQTNIPGIKWMKAYKYFETIGINPFIPLPPEDRTIYTFKQTTPLPPAHQ